MLRGDGDDDADHSDDHRQHHDRQDQVTDTRPEDVPTTLLRPDEPGDESVDIEPVIERFHGVPPLVRQRLVRGAYAASDVEDILGLKVDRILALTDWRITVEVSDEHGDPLPVVTVPLKNRDAHEALPVDPQTHFVSGSDPRHIGNQFRWWLAEEVFHLAGIGKERPTLEPIASGLVAI